MDDEEFKKQVLEQLAAIKERLDVRDRQSAAIDKWFGKQTLRKLELMTDPDYVALERSVLEQSLQESLDRKLGQKAERYKDKLERARASAMNSLRYAEHSGTGSLQQPASATHE